MKWNELRKNTACPLLMMCRVNIWKYTLDGKLVMIKNKLSFVGYADVFMLPLIMSVNIVFKKKKNT